MYKTDQHGEYRRGYQWIDAWKDGMPGWCICELREYSNGDVRVHRGEPTYVSEAPQFQAVHAIYLQAARALGL